MKRVFKLMEIILISSVLSAGFIQKLSAEPFGAERKSVSADSIKYRAVMMTDSLYVVLDLDNEQYGKILEENHNYLKKRYKIKNAFIKYRVEKRLRKLKVRRDESIKKYLSHKQSLLFDMWNNKTLKERQLYMEENSEVQRTSLF